MAIITNDNNHEELLVNVLKSDYKYKDKQYSVTTILNGVGGITEALLKRRHNDEIIKDVEDMVWLMFGTAFHSYLEHAEDEFVEVDEETYNNFKDMVKDHKTLADGTNSTDCEMHYYIKPKLKEEHLTYNCQMTDYVLTGYSDLYNILTNEVTDYKTASINKVRFKDWEDYIKQTKYYALMLNKMGYPCNIGRIIAFLKDWSQSTAKRESDYPKSALYTFRNEFTNDELMESKKEIENYFIEVEKQEKLSDIELPPCDEKIRKFGKKNTYALMKNTNKTATKLFETKEEAYTYFRYNKLDEDTKNKWYVVERKAEDARCISYCDSCHWCKFFKDNYATHVVVLNDKEVYYAKSQEDGQKAINLIYKNGILKEIKR